MRALPPSHPGASSTTSSSTPKGRPRSMPDRPKRCPLTLGADEWAALQGETLPPWEDVRQDISPFTSRWPTSRTQRPRVVFIALDETDDWAHDGSYDRSSRRSRAPTVISNSSGRGSTANPSIAAARTLSPPITVAAARERLARPRRKDRGRRCSVDGLRVTAHERPWRPGAITRHSPRIRLPPRSLGGWEWIGARFDRRPVEPSSRRRDKAERGEL